MLKQAEAEAKKRPRREEEDDDESVKAQKCSSGDGGQQGLTRTKQQLPSSKKNEQQDSLSFPMDVLLRIAAYISHRKSFNRVTASCKDLYEKSRDLVNPPFPSDKVLSRNDTYRSVYCFDLQFTPDSQNLLIIEPRPWDIYNKVGIQVVNSRLGLLNKNSGGVGDGGLTAYGDGCVISPKCRFLVSLRLREVSEQSPILNAWPVSYENEYRFNDEHMLWFTYTVFQGLTETPV